MTMKDILDSYLQMTREGIVLLSPGEGKICYANKPLINILDIDCSPEELVGKPVSYLSIDGFIEKKLFKKLQRVQQIYDLEHLIINRNGEEKHIRFDASLLDGDNRNDPKVLVIVRDVTTLKRLERENQKIVETLKNEQEELIKVAREIEEELKKSENKYRSLIDKTGVGIATTDIFGRLSFVNDTLCSLLGYSKEELLGSPFALFLHPEDRRRVLLQFFTGFVKPQDSIQLEFRVIHKSGKTVHLYSSPTVFTYKGKILSFNAIIIDITALKNTQDKLQKSEEQLKTIIESIYDVIFRLSPEGTITYISQRAEGLHGYKPEQLMGKHFSETTPPEDIPKAAAALKKVLSGETVSDFQIQQVGKSGEPFPVEISAVPVKEEGKIVAIQGIMRDITERKRAEESLLKSEKKYRDLIENIRDVVYSIDIKGKLTYISPVIESITEYKPSEFIGHHFTEFIYSEDLSGIQKQFHNIMKGYLKSSEYRIVTKSGAIRWIRTSSKPLIVEDRAMGVHGVLTDITERKMTEEALRESEENFRLVTQNIPVVVYSALPDEHSTNTFVSGRVEELTGYAGNEFLENPTLFNELIHEDDREWTWKKIEEHRRERTTLDLEYRILTKNREIKWIRDKAVPLLDEDGEILRIDGFMEDVTEKKILEEQLRESQKMEAIGRFAGGIAHDFNNMMTAVIGFSDYLLSSRKDDKALTSIVEQIKTAGERAASLTQQLLTFSRRERSEFKDLDLNRLIADMEPILNQLIGEDIKLEIALSKKSSIIAADYSQVEQIIMNLAVNSRDAMPNGGRLSIKTANIKLDEKYCKDRTDIQPGRYVMLSIADTGCGMDEETRVQIYEPFFTTKEVGKGTGLGLAIVYGIVKQSRGHILCSTVPDKGTTFELYLPYSKPTPQIDTPKEDLSESMNFIGQGTILVVEDEAIVREYTCSVLKKYGYNVLEAEKSEEAIEIAANHAGTIDLLVTDIIMPGIRGTKLAQEMRSLSPKIAILFISGYPDKAIELQEETERGNKFLQKPFTPKELLAVVNELICNKSKKK